MLDAALDGNAKQSLLQLERLLTAGENPIGVLGQISASLRRLATATEIVLHAERTGRRLQLQQAVAQAGVPHFYHRKAQQQLRKLGRRRGEQLHGWLLEADLNMKGASALDPRLILERLIMRLAAPAKPTSGRVAPRC
jgi:DNA polymerase-3 subunit delta